MNILKISERYDEITKILRRDVPAHWRRDQSLHDWRELGLLVNDADVLIDKALMCDSTTPMEEMIELAEEIDILRSLMLGKLHNLEQTEYYYGDGTLRYGGVWSLKNGWQEFHSA